MSQGGLVAVTWKVCAAGNAARPYPAEALHVCEWCFGPLEVVYDYEAIRAAVTRESDRRRPAVDLALRRPAARRRPRARSSLGAGFTPLVRADRLAAELGLGELWIKNDTLNPTGSFKDRVVSVALTKARELGFKVAACASTGNLANSVAAHAAHAGMESVVVHPLRPRGRQGGDHRGVRRATGRGGRQLRRRQPAVRRAGRRAPVLGVRQRQRPHLLRRGVARPWRSRWPSSSAGRRPTTSWCRWRRAAS